MSRQRIVLLVEDNEKMMEANRRDLTDAGYHTEMAFDLAEARACLARSEPDVIVLDILLPDGNGLDFIGEIRKTTAAPVLLLTALDEKEEMLAGFRAGGDDYITKPYDLDEMRERVAALIRRREMYEAHVPHRLICGPLVLDLRSQQAHLDGGNLQLTPKEFALLLMLAQNMGNVLSKETLYGGVWKQPIAGDSGTLWRHLSTLKKKLEAMTKDVELTTARGKGYALIMK
ncbi:response regulator transcription factor [Eubacteriales bacterium OttesenSCG-928-A19]|nr:response regulator transcription factor [Eubacteriales bacterium OttesenSCG-928-A19]